MNTTTRTTAERWAHCLPMVVPENMRVAHFNHAVESLDHRTDYRLDTASNLALLGIALMRFGWRDKDVIALRDALREQFQAMVSKLQRSESIDTSPRV